MGRAYGAPIVADRPHGGNSPSPRRCPVHRHPGSNQRHPPGEVLGKWLPME